MRDTAEATAPGIEEELDVELAELDGEVDEAVSCEGAFIAPSTSSTAIRSESTSACIPAISFSENPRDSSVILVGFLAIVRNLSHYSLSCRIYVTSILHKFSSSF